ncbi:MAG: DoxX family protein [Bdellovibrionota bacterium]
MIKRFLVSITPETSLFREVSVTALRVFAGLAMAFAHGLGKVPPSEKFVEGVAELGFPMPEFFAWAAGLSEFAGGLMLAAGLLTRMGSGFMMFTMAVAAFGRHGADPFQKAELSFLYLIIAAVFLVRGSGRFSIDRFLQ